MNLTEIKSALKDSGKLIFKLPDGRNIPEHFHVTEIGKISKQFIDCGGILRKEEVIGLQILEGSDFSHRLEPKKLLRILERSEGTLNLENLELEVEYQEVSIGKYGLEFDGQNFRLTTKNTACLAEDKCKIPGKVGQEISASSEAKASCAPGRDCC